MNGKFIVLEGFRAVGKSTIAKLLSCEIDAEYIPSVDPCFNELRNHIDSVRSVDVRFCFFLSAMFYSKSKIDYYINNGKNVVTESYFYRTIAFHKGLGAKVMVDFPPSFTLPDYTFYLTCEETERQIRRSIRNKKRPESYWELLSEKKRREIIEEYNKFSMFHIDTTTLEPQIIVKNIIKIISEGSYEQP